jgi:hypothetical protein
VLHSDYVGEQGFGQVERKEVASVVMAALGMVRTSPWFTAPRRVPEPDAMEAVKLAAEGGADLNVVNTDGETALDAAKNSRYTEVVAYLAGKGAKAGTGGSGRGRGRGAVAQTKNGEAPPSDGGGDGK